MSERDLRPGAALGLALLLALAPSATAQSDPAAALAQAFERDVRPFLAAYCLNCHGPPKPKAELDLSIYGSGDAALKRKDVWKDAVTRVRSLDMPPAKQPKQPTAAERERFAAWVESFKTLASKDPGPGPLRRLSQAEYANTLSDLLGVSPKLAAEIPQDVVGEGFNSSISPLHMEKYLATAEEALAEAIKPEMLKAKFGPAQIAVADGGRKVDVAADAASRPLTGTAEAAVSFLAAAEGTYTIRIRAGAEKAFGKEPARLVAKLNGESIGEVKVTAATPSLEIGRAHV